MRFVYDDLGSVGCLPKQFRKELSDAGIHVMAFNPFRPALSAVMNNRNHRKITVIDGYIAYTGGFNLADEYINQKKRFGHWKDTGLRIYGEAAYSFTLMCLELWNAFNNTNDNCKNTCRTATIRSRSPQTAMCCRTAIRRLRARPWRRMCTWNC